MSTQGMSQVTFKCLQVVHEECQSKKNILLPLPQSKENILLPLPPTLSCSSSASLRLSGASLGRSGLPWLFLGACLQSWPLLGLLWPLLDCLALLLGGFAPLCACLGLSWACPGLSWGLSWAVFGCLGLYWGYLVIFGKSLDRFWGKVEVDRQVKF